MAQWTRWTRWTRWEWTKRAQGFLLIISGIIASVIVSAVLGHIIPEVSPFWWTVND